MKCVFLTFSDVNTKQSVLELELSSLNLFSFFLGKHWKMFNLLKMIFVGFSDVKFKSKKYFSYSSNINL